MISWGRTRLRAAVRNPAPPFPGVVVWAVACRFLEQALEDYEMTKRLEEEEVEYAISSGLGADGNDQVGIKHTCVRSQSRAGRCAAAVVSVKRCVSEESKHWFVKVGRLSNTKHRFVSPRLTKRNTSPVVGKNHGGTNL